MWQMNTLWFEVAVVMMIFAIGNILFGHFEEHRPKWRRLLKVVIALILIVSLSITLGRSWAFTLLAIPWLGAVFVIHFWWLPKQGINGWTGEPKDKYYELVKAKR